MNEEGPEGTPVGGGALSEAGGVASRQPTSSDGSGGDSEAALNAFLRCYLEDREAGRERTAEEYCALFPGYGERIERELAVLQGEAREEASFAAESGSAVAKPSQASEPKSAAGKRFGAYVLLRPLGQGGQGLVWLARDTRLERLVALKLLTQLAALSAQALERFHREAQISSRLDDPGICAIYETGSEHGVHYIAMRHVEGESLATLLDRARAQENAAEKGARFPALPADPDEGSADVAAGSERSAGSMPPSSAPPKNAAEAVARAVRLFERLARSLHRAHEAGVVHRDIKPGNIMVARNGHPVLLDFGLAGVLDESLPSFTRTGDVFGTPAYMAPEQIAPEKVPGGARVDRRSDVYALGATLYECLTLRHPFESVTREALYQAIRELDPTDPRRTNPAITADLWTILQTCLAKERSRRYQSALELADDLRRFREGKPIRAHPPSRVYLARRFVRRYRALVTATLIVVATLIVAVVVSLALMFQADEQRKAAEESERSAQRIAYCAQMSQAHEALEKGFYRRTVQLLTAWKPALGTEDLRGFEWFLMWKLLNGGLQRTYPGRGSPLQALVVTADGERFLSIDSVGLLQEVRLENGELLLERDLGVRIGQNGAAFSRDGTRLVTFNWYTEFGPPMLNVWSTDTGDRLFSTELAAHSVRAVALSSSGRFVAWGGGVTEHDGVLDVRDLFEGRELFRLAGLGASPSQLAFSPDDRLLAVGGRDGSLRLVEVATGTELGRLVGHHSDILALAFSSDGRRLVSSAEWIPRVWDLERFAEIGQLVGHQGSASSLAFSNDGERIASGGANDGTLRIWSGSEESEVAASSAAYGLLSWIPSGRGVLTDSGGGFVQLCSAQALPHSFELERPLAYDHTPGDIWNRGVELAFLSDQKMLASAGEDGRLDLWDLDQRRPRATWSSDAPLTALAVADGALVVGTATGKLYVFDSDDLSPSRTNQTHEGRVSSVALSADGKRLASSGEDGQVFVRDRSTLDLVAPPLKLGKPVYSITFCEGGGALAIAGVGTQCIWTFESGTIRSVPGLDGKQAFAFLFAPDGQSVAGVTGGWTPQLLDAQTFTRLHALNGHAGGSYRAIAYAPDGKTIATGSVDKTVKLWQVSTGLEILTLPHPDHVHSVAFSGDGHWLATWCCDGKIRLWPAATATEVTRLERR